MVTDALIDFFVTLATAIGDAWPTITVNLSGLQTAVANLGSLNYFLPIAELSAAVLAVYAIGPPLALTSVVLWLAVGVIRGGGS